MISGPAPQGVCVDHAPRTQDRLAVLVLHNLGDPSAAPAFLVNHVFMLRDCLPSHVYVYHDVSLPLPDYVRQAEFDAIVLDVTFLGMRWSAPARFNAFKSEYDFVRTSNAYKIALPQDEYDCCQLLDEWMVAWSIDCVVTVLPAHIDVLYPRFSRIGRIETGYTGYISKSLLDAQGLSFENRQIDIGYRARRLPPYFGRLGEVKTSIGLLVRDLARQSGLNVDIELGDDASLPGGAWLDFLANCRFVLGANSGSSLLDPVGDIQRAVRVFVARRPNATFDEVEAACFPGQDGLFQFTAVSPRVLEAALIGSCQILVDGEYGGIIKPWDHYIPIRPDAANFQQVLTAMRDVEYVRETIQRCREAIVSRLDLRYERLAETLVDLVARSAPGLPGSRASAAAAIAARYATEMPDLYRRHWNPHTLRRRLAYWIRKFPRAERLLRDLRRS